MLVGKPYNIQHNVHVEVGQYGYKGLPEKWQKILLASGVPEDVVRNNPVTVERVMNQVRMPYSLQSNVVSQKDKDNEEEEEGEESLPKGYAPPSRARSSKLLHLAVFKSSTDIPSMPDNKQEPDLTETDSNSLGIQLSNFIILMKSNPICTQMPLLIQPQTLLHFILILY